MFMVTGMVSAIGFMPVLSWIGSPARLDDIDTELTAGTRRTMPAITDASSRAVLFSTLRFLGMPIP
jgi:hypothetical protein